jgi:hypothetical protein
MPPVILWLLRAVGAVVAAKLIAKEARRINDELEAARAQWPAGEGPFKPQSLERDPETGVYRPKRPRADS